MRGLWAIAMVGLCARAHADDAAVTQLTFEAGHASLSEHAKTALQPVVEALRAHGSWRIAVVGHFADEHAQTTTNRRAAVVKWYFVGAGIETDRIETRVTAGAGDMIEVQLAAEIAPTAIETVGGTTLAFDSAHVRLSDSAKHTLEPVLATLRAHPDERVTIVGFHGTSGSGMETIAKRRAECVKWYLADMGLEVDRIDTSLAVSPQADVVEIKINNPPPTAALTADRNETHAPTDHASADASAMAMLLADDGRESNRHRSRFEQLAIPDEALAVVAEPAAKPMVAAHPATHTHDLASRVDTDHARGIEFVPTAPKREQAPSRVISGARPTDPPVSSDDVVHHLSVQYMPGMSYCYRTRLGYNPELSGKIDIVFTVDQTGHVVDPSATGFDEQLETCIRSQMTRWRFAPPRGTNERFSVTLVLRSS